MEKIFTLTCYGCQTIQTVERSNLEPICNNCREVIAYSKICLACSYKFWGRKHYSLCKKCTKCPKCGKYANDRYCTNCEEKICYLCRVNPVPNSWINLFKSTYGLCNDCYAIKKCLVCNKIQAYNCAYCYECAHKVKCSNINCNNQRINRGSLCVECDLDAKCIQCQKEYKYVGEYCRNCNAKLKCITCQINNRMAYNEFCSECIICLGCCYEIYQRLIKCRKINTEHFTFTCFEREIENYDGYDSDPYNIEYEMIAQVIIKFPYRLSLEEIEDRMNEIHTNTGCGLGEEKYIDFSTGDQPSTTLPIKIYDFTRFD